jgi:hypothetical protein
VYTYCSTYSDLGHSLFSRQTIAELDTYAITEAYDPTFAFGFGDLSVHEVATDKQSATHAYLSLSRGRAGSRRPRWPRDG